MAYQNHTWVTGEPITQERMNALEEGLAKEARTNDTQDTLLASLDSTATEANRKATEALQAVNDSTLQQNITAGQKAWAQVIAAIDLAGDGVTVIRSLNERLTAIENVNDTQATSITGLTTQVTNAYKGQGSLVGALDYLEGKININSGNIANLESAKGTYDTLLLRLNAEDNAIFNLQTEMNNAHESTAFTRTTIAGNPFGSLDARLEEGESRIVSLQTEINDAHSSTALGKTGINAYGSIDERFEAIEEELVGTNSMASRIDTLSNDLNTVSDGKVDKTAIANNLTTDTAGKVLDARQGKALDESKVNYTDIQDNLTSNDSDKPLSAKQGKVLAERLDALDDDTNGAVPALASRVSALESEVDMTSANSRIDEALNRIGALDDSNTGSVAALAGRVTTAENDIDALEATINTPSTGLTAKVGALENTVNDASTGLAATKTIADNAAGAVSALAGRVTTLENNPQSATIVVNEVTYNNDGIPTSISNPSENADYILKKDNKYYYWKYVGSTWHLISGDGSGTSSAEFYATLSAVVQPSENVDYFIGSNTNYIHYRYLNNAWVTILPQGLIDTINVTQNGGLNANTLGSNTNLLADFVAIKTINVTPVYDNEVLQKYVLSIVDTNGDSTSWDLAAGGGGNASLATASITRITDGNLTTISGEDCEISFTFAATDNSGDPLATTSNATWYINRAQVATSDVVVGTNTFDITQYLQTGINNITLSVSTNVDNEVLTRTKTWVVTVVNFALEWDYDESTINDSTTINFSCIPYGTDITKTLHLKIGNTDQTQTITTSGIPTTVSLTNNFNHGVYTAEMYMTATINGQSKETEHIKHDFIVAEEGNNTPIIAATLPDDTIDQYTTTVIPFVVYTPNATTSTVTLAVDGVVIDTRENVGRITQKWYYTPTTEGAKVLTITSGATTKTLNVTVARVNINNNEIGNYAFKLKASELPSNTALQNWYFDEQNPTTSKLQFSNNFDWINGGLQTELDENNQVRQYIRVKSGTTMTIPYKMFSTDPRENGSNFKIIFKIDNCRDYDAIAVDNIAENIGIRLAAHKAEFKSTTTQISTQYGEEEYTELEFEVYKAKQPDGVTDATNQFMLAWIDGVMTTARKYGGNFTQTSGNAQNITIGSTDCDICVYLVKYYPFALNRNDHITNFIADAPNAVEMIRRYNRNNILDEAGDIDYNLLARNNRDCRVWLYDIDRMTTAKDDKVKVNTFQQIWEGGGQYFQMTGTNAKLSVQGTSSVNYRKGAANTDINFDVEGATLVDGNGNNLLADGLAQKGLKINEDSLPITYANTKVNFASCEQVNNMCNAEWYQRFQPYPSLTDRDCMEFAMGVQFIKDRGVNEPTGEVRLFNEKPNRSDEKFYMYSIANMGNSKKNTHVFHSANECCIEIKENTTDAQKMKSFDNEWTLEDHTGNYEMRYPKNPTTAIADGWERFVTWMVASNPNGATNAALPEAVTFEPYTFRGHNREVVAREGRNFAQVLRGTTVSQYAGTYTHDTFNYRMAKMLSECEDYMAMDSVIYHFCFIERHTMVDNVAKNTFWSALKEVGGPNDEEGYWIWDLSKNYDNDTSDGNNNNGLLVFDYGNEATDTRDGTPVFNGNDAVWFVFASNLYDACRTMFINREALGAWNSTTYHNYLLNEQRKIPERVWNECYWYDYLRTYENNIEQTWINFLDGGQKTHQRAHYEAYQEIYEASKYRSAFSQSQAITLRGEAIDNPNLPAQESSFEVTMFNKCYLTIWIGTNYQTVKCQKGVPVTISFYENNDPAQGYLSLANSVINIDSGSMVQAIGDLSLIYPSSGQFGSAKRLRSLQIGSSVEGYYNPNMNTNSVLTFNNKMLEYLYVQNLPQATYNLDLSNCPELKYLNAAGSGFTGFVFANGGILNEAYVNAPASLVMRNLDYLTNANFHLTDPTAVTSLRLEGGKLFNNYTFINQLTNLDVLRLTNINWTLSTVTLLDRLLDLMGINESGFTTTQSYLAGNVSLTGTVYEGKYNSYVEAWGPDLAIDLSHASFVQQHLVIYRNEDGTEIYRQYISHGDPVIDPYYSGILDSAPVKAADIQYSYIFGTLDNGDNYIPFSGWKISSDSQSMYDTYGDNPSVAVNGTMYLYAVYTTTPQRYIVRWFARENQLVSATETGQNYGGGYNLVAPTIKDVQDAGWNTYEFTASGDNCTYRIMTGWDKLPTNITPTTVGGTYDIYATWLERTNVNYNTVLTSDEYSVAEKLLVLKEMSNARAELAIADTFPITLGYDGLKPATTLVASPTRYTGTPTVLNAYTPFAANKSFTIAIDYRFEHRTSSVADEAVLLSCYDNTNGSVQGFKLFYNPKAASPVPQISFGSTASQSTTNVRTIGAKITTRNMLVLRHRAGENILYIYCGSDNTGLANSFTSSNFRKTISWSAIASDAKIVLGGTNISNDNSIMNANGTLYSVKYWEEDLGEGECLQLANWCHETINFAVSDFDGLAQAQHSAINGSLTSKVVLHALNASEMGTIAEPVIDRTNTSVGWDPSAVRTFYNSRIYQAFPTLLQSVMLPVNVPHRKANFDSQQGGYVIASSGTSITQDYVFAPTSIEAGATGATADNHSVEALRAFPWYSSTQMKVKQYSDGVFEDATGNANYTNIRFPYRPNALNRSVTIYAGYPSIGSSFYTWAEQNSITLVPGDILIPANSDVAYIYVSAEDVQRGAPLTSSTASYLSNTRGGWIESTGWWTRSVPDSSSSPNANKFIWVNALGALTTGNTREYGLAYSIAL